MYGTFYAICLVPPDKGDYGCDEKSFGAKYRYASSLLEQETIITMALQDILVLLETRARICKP
jgi:hypothetical protein